MDMPVNVPVDNPNADTEWNDILRKHGVIPEKPPSPTPFIEEALAEGRRLAHANRLENKDLDELDALEDDEDEAFLEQYRQRRLNELNTISEASIHGQIYPVDKPSYTASVTDASHKTPVLVLLTAPPGTPGAPGHETSLMVPLWRSLAQKFGDLKFCQARADLCIENYPSRNTPTVLIYIKGDVVRQIVTLKELGGTRAGEKEWEDVLVGCGAIESGDLRVRNGVEESEVQSKRTGGIRQGAGRGGDDDDDDDDIDWD